MVIEQPPAEFGVAFLDWLRARTEHVWAHLRMGPWSDFARRGVLGPCWQRGTRWTGGLADPSIDQIQAHYGVWFPPQHRLFLQTLHSTSPWMRSADYARHGDQLAWRATPGFYDWQKDQAEIRSALAAVADSEDAVRELLIACHHPRAPHRDALPDLIPIYGHRYVLADNPPWVLSLAETDVILYGQDLREYLLRELHDTLQSSPAATQ